MKNYNPDDESLELYKTLPTDQIKNVMSGYMVDCDIEPEFLGFISIYKRLADIIPEHFTIVDLGCAYNPQCFYFTNHKKYIAVNPDIKNRFHSDNCELIEMTTGQFIKSDKYKELNLNETFAICSYVPRWYDEDSLELCRLNFKNVFTYYPHGENNIILKKD